MAQPRRLTSFNYFPRELDRITSIHAFHYLAFLIRAFENANRESYPPARRLWGRSKRDVMFDTRDRRMKYFAILLFAFSLDLEAAAAQRADRTITWQPWQE
jgi:hypothetical protein